MEITRIPEPRDRRGDWCCLIGFGCAIAGAPAGLLVGKFSEVGGALGFLGFGSAAVVLASVGFVLRPGVFGRVVGVLAIVIGLLWVGLSLKALPLLWRRSLA